MSDLGQEVVLPNRNVFLDSQVKNLQRPSLDESLPFTERCFFTVEDAQVSYDDDKPLLTMDLITTEEQLGNSVLNSDSKTMNNRRANRTLLDQFDRLARADSKMIDTIYAITEANADKKGAVVLTHGNSFPDLEIPFGVVVSKLVTDGQTKVLTAERIVRDLQKPDKYSYILLLACNPDAHVIKQETHIPLIYYLSDNTSTGGDLGKPIIVG